MREHAPVYYDAKSDVWAHHQLRRRARHREGRRGRSRATRRRGRTATPLPMMISMDDPQHQRRRSLVNRGFTPKRVARARGSDPRASATRSSTGCASAASATSCGTSPRRCRCCSSPTCSASSPSAYDDLLRWSDDLIRGTTAEPTAGDRGRVGSRPCSAFREFQLGVIADRRSKPPQDDLVSILCHAEIDGERLDDESIVQETLLILIGGDETTPPRHHRRACSRCSSTPTSWQILARRPGDDRDRASRSCCGGCRRSRTWRAPSSTTSSCAARRSTRATR